MYPSTGWFSFGARLYRHSIPCGIVFSWFPLPALLCIRCNFMFFCLVFPRFLSLSLTLFCLHLFHYFHCFFTNATQCWTLYLYRLMLNNTLWEQTIKWATSYVNLMLVCDFGVRVVLLSASTISHQIYSIFATGAGNHLHYSFNWHAVALRLFVSYFGTCFFSFSFSAWLSRSISLWNERK